MFVKSKNYNPNYLCKIVKLDQPIVHPNAENLVGWMIDGNQVWTNKEGYNPGDICFYFPVECVINPKILSSLNLYENAELNRDTSKKGFFNNKGRVRAIKLRKEPSQGFLINLNDMVIAMGNSTDYLNDFVLNFVKDKDEWVNVEFDTVLLKEVLKKGPDESVIYKEDFCEEFWICKKYEIPEKQGQSKNKNTKKNKNIDMTQFRFHYDTEHFGKHVDLFDETDVIVITKKYHGTSSITANVLQPTEENWLIKNIRKYILKEKTVSYKIIAASRNVIKNGNSDGHYNFDIWNYCTNILKDKVEKGITLYYEIVGYLPNGTMIQKKYDYGCEQLSENDLYKENINFKIIIYRITYTTPQGNVIEYSWNQVKNYCKRYELNTPVEWYIGTINEFRNCHGREKTLLDKLKDIYLEQIDSECKNKVPDEGIVIRNESKDCKGFKLKSFAFLQLETKTLDDSRHSDI